MYVITYEFRMPHINGPDHDWWTSSDERYVTRERAEADRERLVASDRYRNISEVEPDPHDQHPASAIETSTSGTAQRCTVEGCTWSWDYD